MSSYLPFPRKRPQAGLAQLAIAVGAYVLSPTAQAAEIGTEFRLYAPAAQNADQGDVAVVVTAFTDGTTIDIVDDAADGDSDDTTLGAALDRGQSFVTYLSGGSVNDDAGGTWDGDLLGVSASHPVSVRLATSTNYRHDWAPASNGSSVGRNFFTYALPTGGTAHDINAFAYEDARIEILDITDVAMTGGGGTTVDLVDATEVLTLNLRAGEDLWSVHDAGVDLLIEGHSYWIRSSGDLGLMTGAINARETNNRARHGGSFVPSASGSAMGTFFYFGIPHDHDRQFEKELRVIATEDNTEVLLESWRDTTQNWETSLDIVMSEGELHDLWGYHDEDFRKGTRYRLNTSSPVSALEGSWIRKRVGGFNDVAAYVPSRSGETLGAEFQTYVTPPGRQTALAGYGGWFSHLYLFAEAANAEVWVYDELTDGTIVDEIVTVPANGYFDVRVDNATFDALVATGTPSLKVEVLEGPDILVLSSSHNDTFSAYVPPIRAPENAVNIDALGPLNCGASIPVNLHAELLEPSLGPGELSVQLPVSLEYLGSGSSLGAPTVIDTGAGERLQWTDIPAQFTGDVPFSAFVNCEHAAFVNGEVAPIHATLRAGDAGHSGASSDVESTTLELPEGTIIRSLSAIPGDGRVTVLWSSGPEYDITGYQVLRASDPSGPYEVIDEAFTASRGDNPRGFSYAYVDEDVCNCGPVYYKVRTVGASRCRMGPIEAEPTAGAVGMSASGDVVADFDGRGRFFADPGGAGAGGDVEVPAGFPPSGNDFERVGLAYERSTDVLYIGITSPGIFGDVDGDGDSGRTSAQLEAAGGVDRARFALDETFFLVFDTDADGIGDMIVGTPFGSALNGVQARSYNARYPLSLAPFAFGEYDEGLGVHLTREPDAEGGDLLLSISNASTLLGSSEPEHTFSFHAFVGSVSAPGIGSDAFPAAGMFTDPISIDDIDDIDDIDEVPEHAGQIQTGEFAVFGNYFTGSPDFDFVPLGWRHDGEVAVEAPEDDGTYTSPLYFSAGTPVMLEATTHPNEFDMGSREHLTIASDLLSQQGENGDETLFRETRTYNIPALSDDGLPLDHTAIQSFRVVRLECPHTVSATQNGTGGLMIGSRFIALENGSIVEHEEGAMPLVAAHLAISEFDERGELSALESYAPQDYLDMYDPAEVAEGFLPEAMLDEAAYLEDFDDQDDVVTLTPAPIVVPAGAWVVNAYFWSFVNQGETTTEVHFVPTADCN